MPDSEPQRVKGDDLLAALVRPHATPFEGRDVFRTAIEIPSLAGGLREATDFEGGEWSVAEVIPVVVLARVKKVRFDRVRDTDGLRRVHVCEVAQGDAALIDRQIAEEWIDNARDRIERLREKAQGIARLDDPERGLEADDAEGNDGDSA
jgi:hypothetical protein